MKVRKEAYFNELHSFFEGADVPYKYPGAEFVVVRNKENEVIAAGITWKLEYIPKHRFLYVSVHPGYRSMGFGKMVYGALQMLYPEVKWKGVIDSDNDAAARWLDDMGFVCAERCCIAEGNFLEIYGSTSNKMKLMPFGELDWKQCERLATILYTDYCQKNGLTDAECDQIGLIAHIMNGLDRKESFCLIENDEIRAYVCCYDGDERYTRRVGYVGHRMENLEEYRLFLLNFLDKTFLTTGGLIVEASDHDQDATELLALFDVMPEYSCDTYVTP